MKYRPLISVCIPNYNYGHFLPYCLESLLNQTYDNIEILFSDNASTDNSVQIAREYQEKFREKGIFFWLNENKRNLGSSKNSSVANANAEGEIIYTLASDDAIKPDFFERVVEVFEKYPNVGSVLVNREEIDENGNITPVVPFYNKSCVIDKEDQAAVYMMAGIAIPAQRISRVSIAGGYSKFKRDWNVAGDWYNNFLYSCVADVAYIKDTLVQYRVHSGNETSVSEDRMVGIFEHFQLINAFVDISKAYKMEKPAARYEEAVKHLGDMCLRYTLSMINNNKFEIARKYLKLATVFKPEIENEQKYIELTAIANEADREMRAKLLKDYEKYNVAKRAISYDPPEGSVEI